MKKNILYIIVTGLLFFSACKNNLKVGADYKDYTVVFGLLSKNDSAHYVVITKGFFSETENNLVIAQNPDSLYYPNLDVKIFVKNNSAIVDSYKLSPVDMNLEGYQKDSGVFVTSPNWAYKFKNVLDASKTYKIVITNPSTGKVVYGETEVIDNSKMKIVTPLSINNDRLNFETIGKSYTNISWKSPTNVSIYDVSLQFNFEEKNSNTQITTSRKVILPLQKNIANSSTGMTYKVNAEDFYLSLQGELASTPSYITRFVDTPDVLVSAAGIEFKTYIDVSNAQGGITYDQIKPFYTNMKGENVLGLFSTRGQSYSYQIPFTVGTLDSIINSSYTKNLNIVGISPK